jgi:hypothetical protein
MGGKMRALEINPQQFDIELRVNDIQPETDTAYSVALVSFRFSDTSGEVSLLPSEAERIGAWFTRLAKEMRNKK